jgi:hypothetical protein
VKMRIVVSVLVFISSCSGIAQAPETPKVDVFAGYSYVRENPGSTSEDSFSLNGGSPSVTYHIKDCLSAVADFGGYHNGNILGTGVHGTLSTYLFGPRISYRSYTHFTPFAEALFGVAHAGASIAGGASGSQNAFAMAIGEGWITGLTIDSLCAPSGRLFNDAVSRRNSQQSNAKQSARVDGDGDSLLKIEETVNFRAVLRGARPFHGIGSLVQAGGPRDSKGRRGPSHLSGASRV